MIKIREFHRTEIFHSDYGTKALLDNIFRRIFFDYQSRVFWGWIGLYSPIIGYWLIKIKNRPGTYCLIYRGILRKNNFWRSDVYTLQYFPDKDEEINDFFSIQENILRFEPNFDSYIRDFQNRQVIEPLFHVGKIIITINKMENYLIFSLWAPERWIEILKDGFHIVDEKGTINEIVSEGGIDRDIPGFQISYDFFDSLITTLCYQLKRKPSYAILKRRESMVNEISANGEIKPSEAQTIFENLVEVYFVDDINKKRIPNTLKKFFPIFEFKPRTWDFKLQFVKQDTKEFIFKGFNSLWWSIDNIKPTEKIPAILVTGFLGSGKTTLINQIVEYEVLNKNKFIAVIQNEAGQKGIDGKLIDNAYTVETLDDGCICCGIKDKFVNSVIEICNIYKPDLLIIETSGAAETSPIINDILTIPQIRLDSVVTLVDCRNLDNIIKNFQELAISQIKNANILVLTKLKQINHKKYLKIKKFLNSINHEALIIEASKGISIPLLMSLPVSFNINSLEQASKECFHFHSKFFKVLSITIEEKLSYQFLNDFLKKYSKKIFRIKGILKLKEFEKPQIIQSVGGKFELTDYHESIKEGILIFIGKNFSNQEIKNFFNKKLD